MPSVGPEERARIVALFIHGVPQREIAEQTAPPLSTINKISQAYRDEGRLENLPHGHRQRARENEEDLDIVAAAVDSPNITAREIKDTFELSASTSTIRRRLHEADVRSRVPSHKPLVSAANRNARHNRNACTKPCIMACRALALRDVRCSLMSLRFRLIGTSISELEGRKHQVRLSYHVDIAVFDVELL
ncbi:hypothetical protein HPB48_000527 [Haemaphysalis longicornis]|uniref:Transposase Tc1-like domain-containing protein n=1 Tax=Haemaphysalis longicornis TaxID=44386 RepID=A0A9J6GS94_HAELO|nr:hypothetical protein HPB48_000527 [Haemaphysalis longicornis]